MAFLYAIQQVATYVVFIRKEKTHTWWLILVCSYYRER